MPAPIPDAPDALEPFPSYRFSVEVEGMVRGYFAECSGVSGEVRVDSYEEGGSNGTTRKFPGRTSFSNVTLKRGLAEDDAFITWFLEVSQGKRQRKSVTISLWSADIQKMQQWTLLNAFPSKYSVPTLQASANGVLIESIEFAHEGIMMAKAWRKW
jgi:phage tail-like protein